MKQLSVEISRATLNLIFPMFCQGCGLKLSYDNREHLCPGCLGQIRLNAPPFCIRCGKSLSGDRDIRAACPDCLNRHYYFEMAWQCCEYQGLIRELIHKFKYSKKIFLKGVLAEIMRNFATTYIDPKKIDAIIPVPMHKAELKVRGFNQAALLAIELSTALNVAFLKDLLIKRRKTKEQVTLSRAERSTNIKDVFCVEGGTALSGKRLLLVDDVFTTGATADECSKVLRASGAESVWVLVLARGI